MYLNAVLVFAHAALISGLGENALLNVFREGVGG